MWQSSVSHLCGTPALNADGMSVAATKGQRSRARHPRREGGRDRGKEVAREIDPAKSFRQLPPDSHESSVETAGDPPAALPEIDCSLCSSYAPTIIHRVQPYFMQCTFVQYEIKQAMWLPDCTSTPFIIGSEVDVSCVLVLIQPAPWSKNKTHETPTSEPMINGVQPIFNATNHIFDL